MSGTFATPTDPFVFEGFNWGIAYNNAQGTITLLVQSLLPVELLDFQAKTTGENTALLTWRTASETNNQGFFIEKSTDGRQFEGIGFVAGTGNSQVERSYSFWDENFTTAAYYRLRQVDFDGREEFSKLIYLAKEGAPGFTIYPNPASDELTLSGPENAEQSETLLHLINAEGQVVWMKKVDSQFINPLDVSDLQPGVYFIEIITTERNREFLRFVKR